MLPSLLVESKVLPGQAFPSFHFVFCCCVSHAEVVRLLRDDVAFNTCSHHPSAVWRTWVIAPGRPLHKESATGPYKATVPAAAPGFACVREKEQEERCEMASSRLLMRMCLTEEAAPLAVRRPARDHSRENTGKDRSAHGTSGPSQTRESRVTRRACDGRGC